MKNLVLHRKLFTSNYFYFVIIHNVILNDIEKHYNWCLTLYHTMPTFNDPTKEGFGKHWEKENMLVTSIFSCSHSVSTLSRQERGRLWKTLGEKEKMLVTSIFFFPTVFSTLSKREIIILATFNLSSANAFNLVTSKICH